MDRLRSILVGVDFTPCSASALQQAIRIARWNQARLRVVHVLETLVVADLEAALTPFQEGVREGLVRDARESWREFIAGISTAGEIELEVEVGHPLAVIMRRIPECAADLLVLGTHGACRPDDQGTGTLATACVRKAMAKVLLVRDPHVGPFRSVVACIDFSDISRIALDQAIRVATQDSARLHVLHVFNGPWHTLHYRAPNPRTSPDYEMQYRDCLVHRLRAFCEPVRKEIEYLKTEFAVYDHPSPRRSGIGDFAREVGADLVVLGTRGRTNLRHILMGRTAERIVRDTPCSILAVKPPGFEHPLANATESATPAV